MRNGVCAMGNKQIDNSAVSINASQHILSLHDLSANYAENSCGFPILKVSPIAKIVKINLHLRKETILGIVGDDASGQNALARVIFGLIPRESGKIIFDGKEIKKLSDYRLLQLRSQMQMVLRGSTLNPEMNVGRIITAPFEGIKSVKSSKTQLKRVLAQVELTADCIQKYPRHLSPEEYRRVAIARAIMVAPKFILIDNIIFGLDLIQQTKILLLLEQLAKELKLTMIFMIHDIALTSRLCTQVMVMHSGKIIEHEDANIIFSAPKHPYTKELIQASTFE